MLIGACDPILCPIWGIRDPHYGQTLSSIGSSMASSGHGGGGRPNDDDGFFQPNIHYLLFAIALLSSSADWLLDVLVEEIQGLREELHSPHTVKESDGRFVLWVGYTVGVVRALWCHPWGRIRLYFPPC